MIRFTIHLIFTLNSNSRINSSLAIIVNDYLYLVMSFQLQRHTNIMILGINYLKQQWTTFCKSIDFELLLKFNYLLFKLIVHWLCRNYQFSYSKNRSCIVSSVHYMAILLFVGCQKQYMPEHPPRKCTSILR